MSVLSFISEILKPAAQIVDDLTTSKEEKLTLANALTQIENAMGDKMLEYEAKITELQASIVNNEISGNWLQRSWRPILMLAFGFLLIYEYFIANVFSLPKSGLPTDFWDLLKIGIGGYVVGRSAEKIVPQIVNKNKS